MPPTKLSKHSTLYERQGVTVVAERNQNFNTHTCFAATCHYS